MDGTSLSPPVWLWGYFPGIHAVIVVGDRYHMPAIPFIAVLAAIEVAEFVGHGPGKRSRQRRCQLRGTTELHVARVFSPPGRGGVSISGGVAVSGRAMDRDRTSPGFGQVGRLTLRLKGQSCCHMPLGNPSGGRGVTQFPPGRQCAT